MFRQKGTSGKHLRHAPFGYIEDTNNPGCWLIDEETAKVVRHIFALCIDGNGPSRIACMLEKEQVLTVKSYYAMKKGKPLPEYLYRWNDNSVVGILPNPHGPVSIHLLWKTMAPAAVFGHITTATKQFAARQSAFPIILLDKYHQM